MFAVDFLDGDVVEWHRSADGLESTRVTGYTPTMYVAGPDAARADLASAVRDWPRVVTVGEAEWYTSLHADEYETVLELDVEPGTAGAVARRIRDEYEPGRHAPGVLTLYNVDLTPGFRYCLEGEPASMPGDDAPLRTLRITLPVNSLAARDVTPLAVGEGRVGMTGEAATVAGDEVASLRTLARRLREHDPDVLVVSSADLLPLLAARAAAHDVALPLGRLDRDPPYRKLAGANTFESYGQTGHSPARYAVAGRAIVDTSNSFLWAESRLDGLRYLAEQAARPLQETAWGSIGTILTAIQTRAAIEREVLVPWQKWEPERFTDVRTLHAADRGGTTLSPEVGYHEDVHAVDFASLYPNVIRQYNVSPETVDCDCCSGADVPGLEYTICEDPGFLPEVLAPLLDDRAEFKQRIAAIEAGDQDTIEASDSTTIEAGDPTATEDADTAAALRAKSGAIKWILVSCFGYQGYRNAKFGRIECHEAINAYARDILLTAKSRFETGGWTVVHGIVDSIWITPQDEDATDAERPAPDGSDGPEPVADLCAELSETVAIDLEPEAHFDWLCLVPRRDPVEGRVGGRGGALMRYFGRKSGVEADPETGTGYKYRGIECRQRSTPAFVAAAQRDLIAVLDRDPTPEAVCDRLAHHLDHIRSGDVDVEDLVIRTRLSKDPGKYTQRTRTAAALRRAQETPVEYSAGQDVSYVVVDDDARQPGRVRLAFESIPTYDADCYADLLVRAAESVTLAFGWDRADIRRHLHGERDASLSAYG